MGHGDEIVLSDANFPSTTYANGIARADGLSITTMLDAILPLFPLDTYADPLIMMQAVDGDRLDPAVETDFKQVVRQHQSRAPAPLRIDRYAFYERARRAFCVVMTGEARIYGNIILKRASSPNFSLQHARRPNQRRSSMRRREFCKLIAATAVTSAVPSVAETIEATQQATPDTVPDAASDPIAPEPSGFDTLTEDYARLLRNPFRSQDLLRVERRKTR